MKRSQIIAGAVALLVLTVGASLFLGSGNDTQSPFPERLADVVTDTHTTNLKEAETFTSTRRITLSTNTSSAAPTLTETFRIDLADQQYVRVQEGDIASQNTTTFTNSSVTHIRSHTVTGEIAYETLSPPYNSDHPTGPVNTSTAIGGDMIANSLASGEFERVGTTQFNGKTVGVYKPSAKATDALADSPQTDRVLGNTSAYTVQDVNATIYVDKNNTVRHLSYTVTAVRNKVEYTMSLTQNWTAVGTTDLDQPKWVDAARITEIEGSNDGADKMTCSYDKVKVSTSTTSLSTGETELAVTVENLGAADSIEIRTPDDEVLERISTEGQTTTVTVSNEYDFVSVYAQNALCWGEPVKYVFPNGS